MRKTINYIVIIISILMVSLGLCISLNPTSYISGEGGMIIYGVPGVLLFLNMIFQIKTSKIPKEKEKIKKQMLSAILIIYIILLITLLFFGSTYRINYFDSSKTELFSKEHFKLCTNIIPFKTIIAYFQRIAEHTININIVIVNVLGNLVAFAPMGFFIPMLFDKKIKNIKSFILLIIIMIFVVELIQFLTFSGQADIDDIILNTVGATIVYYIVNTKFMKKILQKILN